MSEERHAVAAAQPRQRRRIAVRWTLRLALAVGGALVGISLFGQTEAAIGPFDTTLAFRPVGGGARVSVPPLGDLTVDAYDGPLRLEVQLRRVDESRARALATDPAALDDVTDQVTADLRSAVEGLVWSTAAAALGGAALTGLLVLRSRRESLVASGLCTVLLVTTAGVGAMTWRPEALSQPTYTGLLVNADSLIGRAQDIVARYDAYRTSLEDLVTNVSTLYATVSALPEPAGTEEMVALLHISDLHLNPAGFDLMRQVVERFQVDAVLDSADITDWGSEPENALIRAVGTLGVPYVYVRGNHDSATTAALVAAQPNGIVLDKSAVTVSGIQIVGIADPRFTPDKTPPRDVVSLVSAGEQLAEFAGALDQPPDIALVHNPELAAPLDGAVPLVLAGHTHDRDVSTLDGGTRLMVQGSTGGAGLRALQGQYPEPLTCTVLYLEPDSGRLRAYDEITLGGLGEREVTIQRVVVEQPADGAGDGSLGPAVPTPAPQVPAPSPPD